MSFSPYSSPRKKFWAEVVRGDEVKRNEYQTAGLCCDGMVRVIEFMKERRQTGSVAMRMESTLIITIKIRDGQIVNDSNEQL